MNRSKQFFFILVMTAYFQGNAQDAFTLQDAIKYGVSNSNAVRMSIIATEDASAAVREIKSIGIPKVNGTLSYQYFLAVPAQPIADFITPSVYNVLFDESVLPRRDLGPPDVFKFTLFQPNQLVGGIEASTMLFDGSYLYGVKGAKLYKELIAQERSVTEYGIKSNITKAYCATLIAIENKKVIEKNLENLNKSLFEVKALYANGFAESLDVDRLQLSFDNLSIEMNRIDQLIEVSKNILKFQMNYPLEEDILLKDDINMTLGNIAIDPAMQLAAIDYNKRPEYRQIELGQSLNELDYKRTKAGYLPTARAFASVQGSLLRQNLFDNDETGVIPQAVVGFSANIPIYDGGDKSAKLQRIKLKQDKTALEKLEFERSMTLQVRNAMVAYSNAKSILDSRKKAVDVNQNIYNKTLIKFKEGVGSSVEVTQAESSLYQAQGAYTNALYDLLSSANDLQIALGL